VVPLPPSVPADGGTVVQLHVPEPSAFPSPEGAATPPDAGGPTPSQLRRLDPMDVRREYLRSRASELAASLPAFASHGDVPVPGELEPPERDPENPFGDFFGDGPSAWLEDEDSSEEHSDQARVAGTLLVLATAAMFSAAWGVFGVALWRGAGGAEAGGFILLGLLCWIWYLAMPRAQQHRAMLRLHERLRNTIERRAERVSSKTGSQLQLRRERERYRAMRDERSRRVAALGEAAYRAHRTTSLPDDLHVAAQRVLIIEREMLLQDHRLQQLASGAQQAATPPAEGQ
jgi:hypothetical protein